MLATKTDIKALWAEYDLTGEESLRNEIAEHYMPMVRRIAGNILRKNTHVEEDDLIQNGTIGLLKAVEAFNPARGVPFEIYAPPRIRGAILDDIRELDIVPRLVRTRAKIVAKATSRLRQQLGRDPTPEEIRAEVGDRVADDCGVVQFGSLSKVISHDDRGDNFASDDIAVRSPPPNAELDRKDWLRGIASRLPREVQLAIILYYVEDMTMKEIGKVLALSESRVSQILTHARLYLRDRLHP